MAHKEKFQKQHKLSANVGVLGVLTAKNRPNLKICENCQNKKCSFRLPKLENHRVVHMIVGVVASLVTLANARHWYNLVWLEKVWVGQNWEMCVGVQIWKSWGSACGWVVPATVYVTAPKLPSVQNGTTNSPTFSRFWKFWLNHKQEILKLARVWSCYLVT